MAMRYTRAAALARVALDADTGWPPDLFAVVATLLDETGAYDRVVEIRGPAGRGAGSHATFRAPDDADAVGARWAAAIDPIAGAAPGWQDHKASPPSQVLPPEVRAAWTALTAWILAGDSNASVLRSRDDASDALLASAFALVAYADEASAGIGIGSLRRSADARDDAVAATATTLLMASQRRTLTSLELAAAGATVLPKQHTPQRGLTLRSLTHHLALLRPGGVSVHWHPPMAVHPRRRDHLHVLVIPWPFSFDRAAFRAVHPDDAGVGPVARSTGYFKLDLPNEPDRVVMLVQRLVESARRHADRVDVIVLPELALSVDEFVRVQALAREVGAMLVSGVRVAATDSPEPLSGAGQAMPGNYAVIDPAGFFPQLGGGQPIWQSKHHRWCVDGPQITMYGLQHRLPSTLDNWEWIQLGPRAFNLVTLEPWLTVAALVCEDLARQDPMSEVVRACAPNLLVALLLDGPQVPTRWGARYATVLAEDPGTSVLTVSSLGFMGLTREHATRAGWKDASRTIAHWRSVADPPTCIELPEGHHAALLSLVFEPNEEHAADGRSDGAAAFLPRLAGWTPLADHVTLQSSEP